MNRARYINGTVFKSIMKLCAHILFHFSNSGIFFYHCAGNGNIAESSGMSFLLISIIILSAVEMSSEIEASSEYITRLNFGYIATKVRSVMIAQGYWYHTFYVELPTPLPSWRLARPPNLMAGDSCESATMCYRMRPWMLAMGNLTFSLQQSVSEIISDIHDLIADNDIRDPRRLKPRGLIDGVGKLANVLFGLTTDDQLKDMQQVILNIKGLAEMSSADSQQLKRTMTSVTQLQNERLDNMRDLLVKEHQTMSQLYLQLRELSSTSHIEYNVITMLVNELAKYVTIHDSLQRLEQGVHDLVSGQLSPNIISTAELTDVLANVSTTLKEKSLTLCYKRPQQVYASKTFDYARHGSTLFVRVWLPFSKHPVMNLYKSKVIALPVSGKQNFVTQLQNVPAYFVSNMARGILGAVPEPPLQSVIDDNLVEWFEQRDLTCIIQILQDNPHAVSDVCDFTTHREIIRPSHFRLAKGVYVLTNRTDVKVRCQNTTSDSEVQYNLSNHLCNPCLVTVSCGCELLSGNTVLATETYGCTVGESRSNKLLHGVNLALIQQFYDYTNLSISGRNLFDQTEYKKLEEIHFPIFIENTTRYLANDQKISYSLKKLATSLENDSLILHSPSEALLLDYIGQNSLKENFWHFNSWSWTSYAILILGVAVATLTIFSYQLYRRLAAMKATAVYSLQTLLPKATALQLRKLETTTTIVSEIENLPVFQQLINDIRNLDIALFISLFIVAILLIILIIIIKRQSGRRSYLYLDIATNSHVEQVKLWKFPNATRTFQVKTSDQLMELQLKTFWGWGLLKIVSGHWSVSNTLTNRTIHIPTTVIVSPSKAKKLRRILRDQYEVKPLIIHSHTYVLGGSPIVRTNTSDKV